VSYQAPCVCTTALVADEPGLYCPSCGQQYKRHSGAALLRTLQHTGPLMTAEEGRQMQEHLAEMRRDDDEQKPETD
jgi:hypothetical protein